ncbi:MAG: hypothetical protein ACRDD6_06520 [Tannerellaceae bacterium]
MKRTAFVVYKLLEDNSSADLSLLIACVKLRHDRVYNLDRYMTRMRHVRVHILDTYLSKLNVHDGIP